MRSETIQAWYERWHWAIYVVVLVVALPAPYFFLRLRNDNAIEAWLGDRDPAVAQYRSFQHEFGSSEFVLLALDGCRPDDPRLEPLAERVDRIHGTLPCWTPERVGALGSALSNGTSQPGSGVPLTGRHPAFTALFVPLQAQAAIDRPRLLDGIQRAAEEVGFAAAELHWGGPPVINVALDRWATQSLARLLPVCCAVVFLLLWRLLGRLSLALMVLLCSGWSTLITLAIMAAFGDTMNMFLAALPPMLLVLNLSFGVHLIHQWRVAERTEQAVGDAVKTTLGPTFFSALTTAIGAGSLATSAFAPVRAFGVWAAVGTMVAMAVTFLYIPALLVSEPRSRLAALSLPRWLDPLAPRSTLAWGTLVLVVGSIGLGFLATEADALKFLPAGSKTLDDYRLIEHRLSGLLAVEVVIDTGEKADWAERIGQVRSVCDALRRHPRVENTFALPDLLGPDMAEAAEIVSQLSSQPSWRRSAGSLLTADDRSWRVTAYVDSGESDRLNQIMVELAGRVPVGVRAKFTGLVPLLIVAQQEILHSLLTSFLGAVVVLFPVLTIWLRSLRAAAVSLIPNVAPVSIVFGGLGWLGRPLNAATVMTASIALGLALDNTLHLIEHFRLARRSRAGVTRYDAAYRAIQNCHRAMIHTTLIASLGLGGLALSPFKPTAEFGLLLAALLACALLHDLLITPALLCSPLGEWFASGVRTPAETIMKGNLESAPGLANTPHRLIQTAHEAVRPLAPYS